MISRRGFLKRSAGMAAGATAVIVLGLDNAPPEPPEAKLPEGHRQRVQAEIALSSEKGQLWGRRPITLEFSADTGLWMPTEDPICFPQAEESWGLITTAVLFAFGRAFHFPIWAHKFVRRWDEARLNDIRLERPA